MSGEADSRDAPRPAPQSNARRLIEAAFADTPPPNPRRLVAVGRDEGVSDYFAGKTWRGHRPAEMRFHEVALRFFAPEAFRYYLPAFMLASLEDFGEADVVSGSILDEFTDPTPGSLDLFAPDECEAIIAFLSEISPAIGRPHAIERAIRNLKQRIGSGTDNLAT